MKEFVAGELYKIKNKIYRFKECVLSKCISIPYYFWLFESVDNGQIVSVTSVRLSSSSLQLDEVMKVSEKEVLEIQLKEAEELVQKETARVDSIKAKIEELSKPKLKIGGLYKFKFSGNPNSTLGVLYWCGDGYCSGMYKFITSGLNRVTVDFNTPTGINYTHSEFKEITNPKYSHIGPTILEFTKLNTENFQ